MNAAREERGWVNPMEKVLWRKQPCRGCEIKRERIRLKQCIIVGNKAFYCLWGQQALIFNATNCSSQFCTSQWACELIHGSATDLNSNLHQKTLQQLFRVMYCISSSSLFSLWWETRFKKSLKVNSMLIYTAVLYLGALERIMKTPFPNQCMILSCRFQTARIIRFYPSQLQTTID